MAEGPLQGIRVVDLTRLLPGPYATLALSDLGADVVKVEEPAVGDYLRQTSAEMFAAVNRGKRSVALDLRKDPDTFRKLCGAADVLVESFRPGVLERSGIDFAAEFPRLVIVRVTGFGQQGPWRETAGHDIGYMALAGVIAGAGSLPNLQIADYAGGASAVIALLGALLLRERTGKGSVVDVALADAAMQLILPRVGVPDLGLDGSSPCYRVYTCQGGKRYSLGALEPKFWARFCKAVGKLQWEDRAFDRTLVPEADALFAQRTREEWDADLRQVDCCGEPVVEVAELSTHPYAAARNLFAAPGLLRGQPSFGNPAPTSPAPTLGQHTDEVLAEWLR